jgi:hypothetical protein
MVAPSLTSGLGTKRTNSMGAATSAFDPKRTSDTKRAGPSIDTTEVEDQMACPITRAKAFFLTSAMA